MIAHTFSRLIQSLVVLWFVVTATFIMVRLAPGDALSGEKAMIPEARKAIESFYHFDKPYTTQYFYYLKSIFQGDLGPTQKSVYSVNEVISMTFPNSLAIGSLALFIALLIGIPVGVIAAIKRNQALDHIVMSSAMTGICLPTFVLGPLLILLFSEKLNWLNPSGWNSPSDIILPASTLGLYYAAYVARLSRTSMIETLSLNFIQTARAKGISKTQVILKHALRIAILPVVTFTGPAFAGLISGSFVIETIFNIPGLGRFFVDAAFNRDYFLIQGTALFYGILIVGFNLIVDLLQMYLNPKVRHG